MKIVGAEWTEKVNVLFIRCDCGKKFKHKANRWTVRCPRCQRVENLAELREECVE